MSSDGKQLEALVSFVERKLLPPGFDVKSNERIFNDEGIQIAEFDIEIRGKVGTTTISWLIECRDRPGHGAAPGSWIEQLVGRRMRFGFNKVTAVSTTGFAAGATSFAQEQGIELREVRSLAPEEFAGWLQITAMSQVTQITDLQDVNIFIHPDESEVAKQAALLKIAEADATTQLLISSLTSDTVNLKDAFLSAVLSVTDAFAGVVVGKPQKIRLITQYLAHDHYLLETNARLVRVNQIEFIGELRIQKLEIPLVKTAEYRHAETGEVISQIAAFAPQSILGMNLALEMHQMSEAGETHITMRRLPDDA